MKEKWKNIPGLIGYQASTLGRIRSVPRVVYRGEIAARYRGRVLKFDKKINGAGYYSFCPGLHKTSCVHRSVWTAFNGPIRSGLEVNHKNCDKLDNRLANLELVTPSRNYSHAFENGRRKSASKKTSTIMSGTSNPRNKLSKRQATEILRRLENGEFGTDLGREFGVSHCAIYYLRAKQWHLD